MAVGFKVKYYWYQVGSGEFLNAFFSTIAYNLEERKWGSRYPYVMNHFYNGILESEDIEAAINEVIEIKMRLKEYSPEKVVWDIENLSKRPPWGDDISADITDLSNYFITSEGENLIGLILRALETAKELHLSIQIESI